MKKVLFALPVLLFALALSFCAKQPQEETLPGISGVAGERAPICTLTITGTSTLFLCGTDPQGAQCDACVTNGSPSLVHFGSQTLLSGSGTVNVTLGTNPSFVSIFNTGASKSVYTISAGINSVQVTLNPGACEEISLDANCNIAII